MSSSQLLSVFFISMLAFTTTLSQLHALAIEGESTHVLIVEPGKVYQDKIVLRNNSDYPVRVRIKTAEYWGSEAEAKQEGSGAMPSSNVAWIEVSPEVELASNSKLPVLVKISVPKHPQGAVSWSMLNFNECELCKDGSSKPSKNTNSTCSLKLVTRQNSVSLGANEPGSNERRGSIELLSSKVIRTSPSQPILKVRVKNTGPIDLNLKATAQLRNSQGTMVLQIPGDTHHIPAGSKMKYQFHINQLDSSQLDSGRYEVTIILDDQSGNQFTVKNSIVL